MERIGEELRRELARFGPQGGMPELVDAWPDAVGEMVAANAWPARIGRDGALHVSTSSSAWAFELTHLAPEILGRLREKLGETAPRSLRFAAGYLPEPPREELARRRSEAPSPTPQALERAAELASAIADDELRERVVRAVALGLSIPRSDHSF